MSEPAELGRFRVIARLASQPADVFHVLDPANGHPRAVHIVPASDPGAADALRRDLTTLIEQPIEGVVRVYAFETQGTATYVVTEALAGRLTLPGQGHAQRTEPLAIVAAYCRALVALRSRGIACVQVLPSLLWTTPDGRVALGDFVTPATASSHITSSGVVAGLEQLQYVAPELLTGISRSRTDASDAFAAGAFLYELITHRRPFVGDTVAAYLGAVINGTRERAPGLEREMDRDVLALIDRMLDLDPAKRPSLQALPAVLDLLAREGSKIVGDATGTFAPAADEGKTAPTARTVVDENVQFTLYRPRRVAPDEWEPLLVFAHLSERRADEPDDPDPLQEVQRQAEAILGRVSHTPQTVDSSHAIPRQGDITFIPQASGVQFDPPTRSFRWINSVHREEFLLRCGHLAEGTVIRGRVTAYCGAIIVAEIPLTLTVGRARAAEPADLSSQSARPYRKIFASYSHRDRDVVEEFAAYAKAVGDRYQMDVIDLRSGERWEPALEAMIREADVFQLFWSWNAIDSPYVQREWEYALQLARPSFVRPVYWEEPLPRRDTSPPPALLDLHFESIRPRALASTPTARPMIPRAEVAPAPSPAAAPRAAPSPAALSPAAAAPSPAPSRPMSGKRNRPWSVYAGAALVLLTLAWIPMLQRGAPDGSPPPMTQAPPSPAPATPAASSLTVVVRNDAGELQADTDVELVDLGSRRVVSMARTDNAGRAVFEGVTPDTYEVRTPLAAEHPQRVTVTPEAVIDVVVPRERPVPAR